MREYDLVVIGSGPAGQRAAIAAAKLSKRVAVVERNAHLGGGCIHQGTIPSKTLREAVAYLSGVRQREIYGAAYRVKERITLQDLAFRTRRVIEKEVNVVRDQLLRNYVDVVPGTASFLDPHRLLVTTDEGTRTLSAERIILAVGSRPSRPPGIEFDDRRIIDSDGLLNLPEIPRTMTFVGPASSASSTPPSSGSSGCGSPWSTRAGGRWSSSTTRSRTPSTTRCGTRASRCASASGWPRSARPRRDGCWSPSRAERPW